MGEKLSTAHAQLSGCYPQIGQGEGTICEQHGGRYAQDGQRLASRNGSLRVTATRVTDEGCAEKRLSSLGGLRDLGRKTSLQGVRACNGLGSGLAGRHRLSGGDLGGRARGVLRREHGAGAEAQEPGGEPD